MRFKAEEKDWIIFGAFCILLLYLCAILVLNLSSLATEGVFYGFLPFEAFTSRYFSATIVIFILALIFAFASVKSYIFERESGFGFTVGSKKNNGYSRWAKAKEVKQQLKMVDPKAKHADAAGIVVINDGKTMWVDDGEAHNIVIGATGSGKTQAVVFPMVQSLAKHGESMIITDPKGEIYETTGEMLRRRGYNIVILNFRNPQNGNSWNPMALPYKLYQEGNSDKAIELLDDLALNILYDEKSSGDPYWEKAAADYFTGLSLGLFEDATEEQINLNSLNLMASLGEERFGGPNNNYMKEYFNSKDPSRPAYINASGVVFTAEETKQGVLSTFKQKIKLFSSRDNLSEMLSRSDFDMKEIGRQKTAVFMIVQDEKKTLHPLATIFIKQCYETLIDVAQESGGKLPYRTNFILDEFANMPPLKDVTTMVTAARSRLIRFTFIIQNYAQLTQVYGKENAETIKGNCNIMYLISSELGALEELSKLCGEVKSKDKDKTASTPLVTVSDLQRLQQYETISLRLRTMPFKTKLVPNWQMDWGKKYPKAVYPQREKKEIALFNIKDFVKDMKQKKMSEMMNNSNGMDNKSMPANGPSLPPMFGGNPFAMNNPFSAPSSGNSDDSFNIDDLVKKIDAKIAELEEEERIEKEKHDKEKVLKTDNDDEVIDVVEIDSSQKENKIIKTGKPTLEEKLNTIKIDDDEDDESSGDERYLLENNKQVNKNSNKENNIDKDSSIKINKPLIEEKEVSKEEPYIFRSNNKIDMSENSSKEIDIDKDSSTKIDKPLEEEKEASREEPYIFRSNNKIDMSENKMFMPSYNGVVNSNDFEIDDDDVKVEKRVIELPKMYNTTNNNTTVPSEIIQNDIKELLSNKDVELEEEKFLNNLKPAEEDDDDSFFDDFFSDD